MCANAHVSKCPKVDGEKVRPRWGRIDVLQVGPRAGRLGCREEAAARRLQREGCLKEAAGREEAAARRVQRGGCGPWSLGGWGKINVMTCAGTTRLEEKAQGVRDIGLDRSPQHRPVLGYQPGPGNPAGSRPGPGSPASETRSREPGPESPAPKPGPDPGT